jgi:hypothetical protein
MVEHTTIAVGQFSLIAVNPLVDGGIAYSFDKFRLDETFQETTQIMDNAIIIPLVDGSTITLTNTITAGSLKMAGVRHSNDYKRGDIVAYANYLLALGAIVGSIFMIAFPFNGQIIRFTLHECNVKTVKQLTLAGNNVNTHEVEFTYAQITQG